MEIRALKVEKNRDLSEISHPGGLFSIGISTVYVQNLNKFSNTEILKYKKAKKRFLWKCR